MKLKTALIALLLAACTSGAAETPKASGAATATAYFAGGCFWCMESDFEKLPGVIEAVSGYMGGRTKNPTYEESSSGTTGHAEAVEVRYDPAKVSYAKLLDWYWYHVDPTVKDRQFCDEGSQYRTAIFPKTAEDKSAAEASKGAVAKKLGVTIYTEIADGGPFYRAEEYHQDYYKKNPIRYAYYRNGCGRDARVKQIWGNSPH